MKNLVPAFILGVLIGACSAAEEIFIDTPGGEQLLSGHAVHDEFVAYIEKYIGEKLKDAATSILRHSKVTFDDLFSQMLKADYPLIPILHSLSEEDIILSNFLGELAENYFNGHIIKSDTIRRAIDYPADKGFQAVKTLVTAHGKGLLKIPNHLVEELLLIVGVTRVMSEAAELGDMEVIQWLLASHLPFDSHLVLDEALNYERMAIIRLLIGEGALDDLSGRTDMVDRRFDNEGTLLHIAAGSGRRAAVTSLLQAGAEVDAIDSDGLYPLHIAVVSGDTETAGLLLDYGADVNLTTPFGDTSLHLAVLKGDLRMTETLIGRGAQLDRRNNQGLTPLTLAENIIIAFFLRYTEEKKCEASSENHHSRLSPFLNEDIEKLLPNANFKDVYCRKTDIRYITILSEIANVFIRKGEVTRLAPQYQLLLTTKARNLGDGVLSQIFINLGYDFPDYNIGPDKVDLHELEVEFVSVDENLKLENEKGHSSLHNYAASGDLKVVKKLLEKGADVDAMTDLDWTPLHFAANASQPEIVDLLLEKGAKVDARTSMQETPLHLASANGHAEVVKILLANGAEIDSQTDANCTTPLYMASMGGHSEVVKILINSGASVDAKDCAEHNYTPLQVAVFNRRLDVAKYLREEGADIDTRDALGNTMLFTFALAGDVEVVRTLLSLGADPKLRVGPLGYTALHAAAARGHHTLVPILLSGGADVDAATVDGVTPLCLAAIKEQLPVIEALLEGGADDQQMAPSGVPVLAIVVFKRSMNLDFYSKHLNSP